MPNVPETNTYETINYNMFKYGFDDPSGGESLEIQPVISSYPANLPGEWWNKRWIFQGASPAFVAVDKSITPNIGDKAVFYRVEGGSSATANIGFQGFDGTNGHTLSGGVDNSISLRGDTSNSTDDAHIALEFVGGSIGWLITSSHNVEIFSS